MVTMVPSPMSSALRVRSHESRLSPQLRRESRTPAPRPSKASARGAFDATPRIPFCLPLQRLRSRARALRRSARRRRGLRAGWGGSPLRAETDLVAPCTAISMVQRIGISGAAPFPHSAGAHLRAPRVSGRNSQVDRGRPLFSTLLICSRRHGRDPEKDVLVPNKAKRGKNHASISGRACTALRPAAGGRPTRRGATRGAPHVGVAGSRGGGEDLIIERCRQPRARVGNASRRDSGIAKCERERHAAVGFGRWARAARVRSPCSPASV